MICEICGKEFKDRIFKGRLVTYCSRTCYDTLYWKTYRRNKLDYFKKRHKETYVPHPKPLKYKSDEEREQARKEYSKKYYNEHKEYYKEKQHIYYLEHKNDLDRRIKHRAAMMRYYYKKKEEQKDV